MFGKNQAWDLSTYHGSTDPRNLFGVSLRIGDTWVDGGRVAWIWDGATWVNEVKSVSRNDHYYWQNSTLSTGSTMTDFGFTVSNTSNSNTVCMSTPPAWSEESPLTWLNRRVNEICDFALEDV